MDRSKVYALIKQYDLKEEVQSRFGENYTRVPTKKLEQVLWDYDCTLVDEYPYEGQPPVKTQNGPASDCNCNKKGNDDVQEVNNAYEAACLAFLGVLKDSGLLYKLLEKL